MTSRIAEFDIWRPGYGGASVAIYVAGTSTLASVYTNEALTIAADNPQTLSSKAASDGTNYGKFSAPIYTAQSYSLSIDGIENTGVIRPPFTSLDDEDASAANVTASGSSHEISLEDYIALSVNVANYGTFVAGGGGVAATNTATMELAIAALTNGGEVIIPAGTYNINSFDVPEGVVIRGNGREATTLKSVLGDVSFTLIGDRSGFKDITLDGNSLSTGSIGIKSVGNNETIFSSVMIRRFETGVHFLGGKGHIWFDFSIENTETAAKLHGDTDAGDSANGSIFQDLTWTGGLVSVATTIGVSLSYEDTICNNVTFVGVGFEDCTGTAVDINGAQSIEFLGCWFDGNTKNINIQDDTDLLTPATAQNNDVIKVHFNGGRFSGGEFEVTGTCQDVVLNSVKIENVDFVLSTPVQSFLVLKNCYEDANVTIAGESTKLVRSTTSNNGASFGVTTTSAATKAWSIALEAGQVVYLTAKVVAKGRNVAQRAVYNVGCGAYRLGSSLAYDTQTANFTAGKTLTGASSGATARIQADSDSGTTGTLTLTDIKGEFIDNEIITDDNGTPGSATANGVLTPSNATLDGTGNVALRAVYESNASWAAVFAANGTEIEFQVTGDTNQTVEWTVDVEVVST